MRNAVKTVGRLAKGKSITAYKEVRSKFKDLQLNAVDVDVKKPRSAPSSPKFRDSRGSIQSLGVSPTFLARKLKSTPEKSHGLRRCETSVSQHYNAESSSPGYSAYPPPARDSSSSDESSNDDDELNMAPLNLNLMEDMKDILSRTSASSYSSPPSVDRSVNSNFFFCFFSSCLFFCFI